MASPPAVYAGSTFVRGPVFFCARFFALLFALLFAVLSAALRAGFVVMDVGSFM
jgi:hypothetical protein